MTPRTSVRFYWAYIWSYWGRRVAIAATVVERAAASLAGTGAFAAVIELLASATSPLVGSGSLSATATLTASQRIALAGSGALLPGPQGVSAVAAPLVGSGGLIVAAAEMLPAFATMNAIGGLGATPALSTSMSSTLAGLLPCRHLRMQQGRQLSRLSELEP